MARHPGFLSTDDAGFLQGVQNGTITKAIDDSASGIAGMAGNTRNLAADMENITRRMGVNRDVVAELEKETVVFDNL